MKMRSRKGFTLIELLVVIAIIAILAAILFPVFAKARAKAREAGCLSNCKQIGIGVQMYCDDYDGSLPPYYVDTWATPPNGDFYAGWGGSWAWNQCIYSYVKNEKVFFCPDKPTKRGIKDDVYDLYAINSVLAPPITAATTSAGPSVNNLEYAADTFFVMDGSTYYVNPQQVFGASYGWSDYIPGQGSVGDGWSYTSLPSNVQADAKDGRHNGRINTVFADGHAKGVPSSKVVRQCELYIQRNPNAFEGTIPSL